MSDSQDKSHTPTPWKIGTYLNSPTVPDSLAVLPGDAVAGERGPAVCLLSSLANATETDAANAALIVRAVNSHADLLAVCRQLLAFAESVRPGGRVLESDPDFDAARAAIVRATP